MSTDIADRGGERGVVRWYVPPYEPSQVAVGKRFVEVILATEHDALVSRCKHLEARVLNLKEALMGIVNQPLRYNANRIEIDCNDHGDAMARVRIARRALALSGEVAQ